MYERRSAYDSAGFKSCTDDPKSGYELQLLLHWLRNCDKMSLMYLLFTSLFSCTVYREKALSCVADTCLYSLWHAPSSLMMVAGKISVLSHLWLLFIFLRKLYFVFGLALGYAFVLLM